MATDIIVSEMTSATQINTNDLMIMTQPDLQAETGYSTKKGTVLQVANKMLKGTEYLTDLPDFTDKTVLGGLEELKGDLTALLPVNSASGAIANFDTDLALPLVDCKANIVASQASGTPTPSSPLPITGYSSANITRCGVNLWDGVWEEGSINATTGADEPSVTAWRSIGYIAIKPNTAYYVAFQTATGKAARPRFYDINKNYIGSTPKSGAVTTGSTFVPPDGACYMRLSPLNENIPNHDIGINYPSTDTNYHAYNGQTYAIAFGQTVYGGVLDVTRGKLHVTHANIASYNGESINEPWLSSMDVYTPGGTPTTGAQVVYPLTTPFDIDLTPVQITALLGVNNVYNDTNGDTEVKYKEGIQHYIDKKIAATQALIL